MAAFHPRRILYGLVIVAIAVVFTINFGPGSSGFSTPRGGTAAGVAAVVNGREIPLVEFQRAYAMQLQTYRALGNPIPESLARQLGLPQQVLQQLVNTELLAQAADSHGIVPGDAELRDIIHKNPDFQKDGRFDFQTYQGVLRDYYRKTAPQYEDELRRRLAAQKMLEVVESGAVVSEDELKARYEKEGNQAKVVFARFLPAMYADKVPAPKPAELAAFQKAKEKEIAEYYEANKFVYQQPERLKVRQILIRVQTDAAADRKAEARARAEAVRKRAEAGEDFAKLALEANEDPITQAAGGELGWVERGSWVPELAEAAFALQPGQVTQPVETQQGFQLVKVEEKQPAKERPLAEVQAEIATALWKKEQAQARARAAAEKALADLKAGKSSLTKLFPPEKEGGPALLRFETETRPEAVETDTFTAADEALPHLGPAPEVVQAVFAAQGPQVLERAFPLGEGFLVAQVTERNRPSPEGYETQKEELRAQARRAKQIELQESFLKALQDKGKVVTNNEAVASLLDAS